MFNVVDYDDIMTEMMIGYDHQYCRSLRGTRPDLQYKFCIVLNNFLNTKTNLRYLKY